MGVARRLIVQYRRALVVAVHLVLWTAALLLALALRFDFEIPSAYGTIVPRLLVASLAVRVLVHWRLGLFHGLWRYSGARDLRSLLWAATLSSIALMACWAFMSTGNFPRSVFALDWAFSILIVGGLRFSIRTIREVTLQNAMPQSSGKRRRILVIGAGDAGEMLMREIVRIYAKRYEPVGLLDDNAGKHGEHIHGVPVLGPISQVTELAAEKKIDEIIVAIPSLSGRQMRELLELCRPTGAQIRTLPGVDNLIDGSVTVSQLAEVNIEDLLRRVPVTLDAEAIGRSIQGRVVMVTGAGGSIGSELCRQVSRFNPKRLLLVEQAENSLFHIDRQLRAEHPSVDIVPFIADICDSRRLEEIFAAERPHVVFHAAAHKHVPLMEANPGEAIKNNVFGTRKVADLADRYGAEKFVMVSTDKAVNPTSIMGVSKRVAEMYVQALSQRSRTQFVTVRFGNVLGSAGSVVPLFREQIAKGGPVTVTHPEMQRYFMTIPEACQLVMQSGVMGKGGEIFVLDMGEPVKIVDLARDLIRLSGYSERDIEIEFTGMRPGEKLFEELAVDEESVDKTKHPKIYVGKFRPHALSELERAYESLHAVSNGSDVDAVKQAFKEIVPEYKGGVSMTLPPDEPPVPTERSSQSIVSTGDRPTPALA
ncbi:UDP-N-acetylglucosamine 4,6-dehydratase [Labilithrix luteola]|uniref:UDP-N-acetylglucosamine 4,6-dehydratase n=1 Tax=Labilithrix luteola TaxID=1391654 RepID=A0A0K1Q6Y5_9BACT|nr:nucleoside-diphosphate sugar epimerase/dehydratase [Labilithrix luteola]AKV01165.1 UDP-N-acetylglucosamine 4,6-dehydratase [Labilithrix luteola]